MESFGEALTHQLNPTLFEVLRDFNLFDLT